MKPIKSKVSRCGYRKVIDIPMESAKDFEVDDLVYISKSITEAEEVEEKDIGARLKALEEAFRKHLEEYH